MILVGNQRGGAAGLASHLMNDRDNDHVTLAELRGFVASDLHGAFSEAHAISKGTKCEQFLFSLSLNPPKDERVVEEAFIDAANRAETILGLTGQPRAIVFHEKEGRRHAHVVWSRIDGETMTAVNLPHYKRNLNRLAKDLYLDHGWDLPEGMRVGGGANPLNFTLDQWQQAKRLGRDPREIKQVFAEAWARSDSLKSLSNALSERGYHLARGDRRGIVALDWDGTVYSFARWAGVKTKEVKSRLGDGSDLASVEETNAIIAQKVTAQLRGYIRDVKDRQKQDTAPLLDEKAKLVREQRSERHKLGAMQRHRRWDARVARASPRTGLKGLWDRLSGRAAAIRQANAIAEEDAVKRDRSERDDLVADQLKARQGLQIRLSSLRKKQAADRALLARTIGQAYRSKGLQIDGPEARAPSMASTGPPGAPRGQKPKPPGLDL